MTRRIVTAAFISCIVLAGCSERSASVQHASRLPGYALFNEYNCVLCHGPEGEGRPSAPALRGIAKHFTRRQLIEYIKDPAAYAAQDARLSKRTGNYPAMMPRFGYLEPVKLEQLADYVLALGD